MSDDKMIHNAFYNLYSSIMDKAKANPSEHDEEYIDELHGTLIGRSANEKMILASQVLNEEDCVE